MNAVKNEVLDLSFRVYLAAAAQLWYCQFKRGDRRNIWNYQTKSLFTNSGRFDWSQGRGNQVTHLNVQIVELLLSKTSFYFEGVNVALEIMQ